MEDFDFAFAFAALARAHAAAGNRQKAQDWRQQAEQAGGRIQDAEDRDIFLAEFNRDGWFGIE